MISNQTDAFMVKLSLRGVGSSSGRSRVWRSRCYAWCIMTVVVLHAWGRASHAQDMHTADPLQSGCVAFVNVSVVPMHQEVVLDDHTVLVCDGRIVQVGPAAKSRIPQGVLTVNGRGKFLVPGLADMHVHILGKNVLPLFVANGVTTVRNMFGSQLHLRLRDQVENGTLLGPRIVTSGPIIDGDPPVWPGSAVVTTAEAGVQVARKQAAAGYDFLKVYERLPLDAYDAIMNTAQELRIPVAGHVPSAVGLQHALSMGQRSIEHLTGYGSALETTDAPQWDGPEHYRSMIHGWLHHKKDTMQALTEMTARSGVWNCPTHVVMERAFAVGDVDAFRYDGAHYIGPILAAMWRTRQPPASITTLVQDTIPIRRRMIGALHRAGAGILLGTDCSNRGVVPGFSIHAELKNLVDAGLTPFDAIRCGTTSAAEYLGENDSWGTIEVGRAADLVLLDGNPLISIENFKKISGVTVRGRWIPRSELTKLLEGKGKAVTGS